MMESSVVEGEEYYNPEGSEWSQKVDTGQLCRVCANANEYLIPIFDGEGLEHELGMKIQKHLPIEVTETDSLPQQMCYQCASTLIAWHDLVISCVEADKKLREIQVEEEEEDDKGAEIFESPSLDSEMTDDDVQASTSETQNQVSKTRSPKKTAVSKVKKPKLKMVLVKGPPAGSSGQKTASKTQVAKALELAKSKDGANQDSASERCQPTPLASFKTYHETCQTALQNICQKTNMTDIKTSVHSNKLEGYQTEADASCNFCGCIFVTKSELASHLSMRHSDTVFHCEICDGIFCESKSLFIKHMENHEDKFKTMCITEFVSALACTEKSKPYMVEKCANFPCRDCGRIFVKKSEMVWHMKGDHEVINVSESIGDGSDQNVNGKLKSCLQEINDKFPCSICGEVFATKFDAKIHSKNVHFLKPLKCRSDNSKESEELQHVLESNSEAYSNADQNLNLSEFTYSVCGKSSAGNSEDAVRHRKDLSLVKESIDAAVGVCADLTRIPIVSNKEITCVVCERVFTRKADMRRHVKNVHHIQDDGKPSESHGVDTSTADIHPLLSDSGNSSVTEAKGTSSDIIIKNKDKKSSTDDAVSRAKIKVDGKTYFHCQVCGKNLFRRCTYVRHMRIHTGEKPFTCHVCGKQFRAEPQIQRHVREVHEGIKEHACPICGRKFANTRTRNDHVTVHTGERRLVCHLCGKRFKTRATFHTHKRSHTNLFPHKCTYCGKSFRRKYECAKHMMIHTGEHPHECDMCGKRFRYQNEMIRHKLIHSDHKPFRCMVCHLSFRQVRYLKNHTMKTHQGHQLGGKREDVHLEEIGIIN